MREIKFRAWDLDFKKMWLSHDSCFEYLIHENKQQTQQASIVGFMISDACHLMQFTGLKDKNGVEIYDGDILSRTSYHAPNTAIIAIVIWQNGGFILKHHDNLYQLSESNLDNYNVIGNIYENPELLKNKEQE